MFDAVFQAEDIIIEYSVAEDFDDCSGRFVEADSSRLSQIIINLITNAIKVLTKPSKMTARINF